MADVPKKPVFRTVTHHAKAKPRFALVDDASLLEMMRQAGVALSERPRRAGATHGELIGVFALPTNNVLELYRRPDGQEVGILFTSLDVWMTYDDALDPGA